MHPIFWILVGCVDTVEGSGTTLTEERVLEPFDSVESATEADLIVTVGESGTIVSCDDNLLELLLTEVVGRTLRIDTPAGTGIDPHGPCVVEVGVASLTGLDLSGSGDVDVLDLDGVSLGIHLSGSGDIRVDGQVNQVDIRSSGSGDIAAEPLTAGNADLRSSGSGDLSLTVSGVVTVDLSGSGDVHLFGDPEVHQERSGSGDVTVDGDR